MNLNMNFPEGKRPGYSRGFMFKFKCMFK